MHNVMICHVCERLLTLTGDIAMRFYFVEIDPNFVATIPQLRHLDGDTCTTCEECIALFDNPDNQCWQGED